MKLIRSCLMILASMVLFTCGQPEDDESISFGHGQRMVTFSVEGMTCSKCEDTITTTLKALPGVDKAIANQAKKKVDVVFDPNTTEHGKIRAAIEKNPKFKVVSGILKIRI